MAIALALRGAAGVVVAAAIAAACGGGAAPGRPDAAPAPEVPIALTPPLDALPFAMAASGGYVAWTSTDTSDTLSYVATGDGGSVHTASLDTQGGLLSFANAHGLAWCGSTFYAAVFYMGVIDSVVPGGMPQVSTRACLNGLSTPCGRVAAVAASATDVYYTIADLGSGSSDHGVWRQSRSGGVPTRLYDHPSAQLAVDQTSLYWASQIDGALEAGPVGGGAIRVLSAQACATDVAVDAHFVYWVSGGGSNCSTAGIWRLPLAGGTPEALPSGSGPDAPCNLASDGTSLYWTTAASGLAMRAVNAGAGDPPSALLNATTSTGACGPIALDATNVYLARPSTPTADGSGTSWEIVRVAR